MAEVFVRPQYGLGGLIGASERRAILTSSSQSSLSFVLIAVALRPALAFGTANSLFLPPRTEINHERSQQTPEPASPSTPHQKLLAPSHQRKRGICGPRLTSSVFKNVTRASAKGPCQGRHSGYSFASKILPTFWRVSSRFVGPPAAGKSTMLRTIAALKPHFPPTKGEVLVFANRCANRAPNADS